jgi:hypothetical protein
MMEWTERARRMTRHIDRSEEILGFLTSAQTQARLEAAADKGYPPVGAISQDLVELLLPSTDYTMALRQFCGLVIRGVLEQAGFEFVKGGVRISNDPMFKTGSVYRRVREASPRAAPPPDLLSRIIQTLNRQEALAARELLDTRIAMMTNAERKKA